jgi:superfamily II DNA/RNA helicase
VAITASEEILRRAQSFLINPQVRYFHAEAHARAILRNVARPSDDWPKFRSDLDDRLHHAAHYLLWAALHLLEAGRSQAEVSPLLLFASESLEFLCADPSENTPVQLEQAVTATFGYYLAGHYARSYVLLKEAIPDGTPLPPAIELLVRVLRKQFGIARRITVENFALATLNDDDIAQALLDGRLSDDEAYDRILLASATQAVSFYLEYPKTGLRPLLDTAISILDDAILIAKEKRHVDWWWWLFCLRHLFRELGDASPWTQLKPLQGGDNWPWVEEYIRAGLRNQPPIVEFWPSQSYALPTIIAADRRDFCLKMPTSSGKTRIAELAILRFILDHGPDASAKCIYIAPYRSLAVEIEQTLQRSLGTLGISVSQLYGGFEITPADIVFLNQYRILIATPEKFDALLRFVPELREQLRLTIIDEGHIVDPNLRGLRFEFFIHRLLRRLRGKGCRFVFISAVLPNASQFAEWIAGSADKLVESQWRPSRLILGRLGWNGDRVRIDYTHEGKQPFQQECFVPRFVTQRACKGVPGMGKRRNPFPADAAEAFSMAAILFAKEGATMVFVPQQRMAESTAQKLLEALKIHRVLTRSANENFALPVPGKGTPLWAKCWAIIEAEMGSDSLLLELLEEGIVVHHGRLPGRVRLAVEELARAEAIRLIVATTTLAQGINLPIRTVLVRGLQMGEAETVNPMTFWNICGRAGRAMKENEGQILFCVDETKTWGQLRNLNNTIASVIDRLEQASVVSAMLLVLQNISQQWSKTHPGVSLSDLCIHLAENDFDWVEIEERARMKSILDILDGHLLAMSEEFSLDPTVPDQIQDLMHGSLLFIQLRDNTRSGVSQEVARDVFHARIRHIHRRHPDRSVRERLYRLGMSLSACETIEEQKEVLLELFCEADKWFDWTHEQRSDLLCRISQVVFALRDTAPKDPPPEQWPTILTAWLAGISTANMVTNTEISSFATSPNTLCLLIEELCGYLMPWGLNSILMHLTSVAMGAGRGIPAVCSFFAGMTKYGVSDPVAVCIIPYLDNDRALAIGAATVCPYDFSKPDIVIRWILNVTEEWLVEHGLEPGVARAVICKREAQRHSRFRREVRQAYSLKLPLANDELSRVAFGDKVLIIPQGNRGTRDFCVFTIQGAFLGNYEFQEGGIPDWWGSPHFVDAEVTNVSRSPEEPSAIVVSMVEL